MKVYYFNDEQKPVYVHLNDLYGEPTKLVPAQGMAFELKLKDGAEIPFIKRWSTDIILIQAISEGFYTFLSSNNKLISRDEEEIRKTRGF